MIASIHLLILESLICGFSLFFHMMINFEFIGKMIFFIFFGFCIFFKKYKVERK